MKIEPIYLQIGVACLEARQRRGLTQAQVAQKMDWTRASVANLETGRQRIMLHDIPRLANALGLAPGQLLPREYRAVQQRRGVLPGGAP